MRSNWLWLAPVCFVLAGQQAPVFRSQVDLVTVDVHVVDPTGRPVADLRPEDFSITVDGKTRRAAAADLVSYHLGGAGAAAKPSESEVRLQPDSTAVSAPGAPGSPSLPSTPTRLVLLVVDEGNIRPGAAKFAADAAATFIERAEPADRIGLLTIPESTVRVEPTTDRAAVRQALRRVSGHMGSVATQLGAQYSVGLSEAFMFTHDRRGFGQVLTRECVEKVPGADSPSPQCAADVEMLARTLMTDARQRMLASARRLTAVMDALATVEGPKTIVVVSEELPVADDLAERKDFEAETARISAAAARAQASVYVLQLQTPEFDVESRMHPATAGADAAMRSSGLEAVTTLTGGRRLMVSGRAEPAFERIARETSAFYVVGFEAQASDRDGRPHVVSVKVNRAGADVRARREFAFTETTQKVLARSLQPPPPRATPPESEAPTPPVPAQGEVAATPKPDPTAADTPVTPAHTVASTPPPATAASSAAARSIDDLLLRAGGYVVDYGHQMSIVIGVERYAQWLTSSDFTRPVTRQLVSEFALVRIQDDWLGFRDVVEVDGTPVPDRQQRLQKVLLDRSASSLDQGRRIADESARHNVGAIQRNFNVPTTALFFLHPKNQARFKYKKDGDDRVDGVAVWKVKYEETRKPTIIRTSAGKDMPLKGAFWIDPTNGRVLKTNMELVSQTAISADITKPRGNEGIEDGAYSWVRTTQPPPVSKDLSDHRVDSTASITVSYKADERMGLLLPVEMRETYEGAWARSTTNAEALTKISCIATYSDFKRFETSGRVVEPK